MKINDAVRSFLDGLPNWVGFSTPEFNAGVAKVFGAPLTETQKRAAMCQLEREGHDDRKGRTPGLRVLFAATKAGLVPSDRWRDAGGSESDRRRGHYVRVPAGSAWIHWWKKDSISDESRLTAENPVGTASRMLDTVPHVSPSPPVSGADLSRRSREAALTKGERTYVRVKPCSKCGSHICYASSGGCKSCGLRRATARVQHPPEIRLPKKRATPAKKRAAEPQRRDGETDDAYFDRIIIKHIRRTDRGDRGRWR